MMTVEFTPHPDQYARFDAKVSKGDGCWEWTGALNNSGYGVFGLGKAHGGALVYAHRYSYARFVAPLTPGLSIDHLCKNRACVRPDHLEEVTPWVNTQRSGNIVWKPKRECKRGHLFSGDNLYVDPSGRRACRECQRMHVRAYKKRRRAAS